jgi:uncharacterized repeat protein (TIGR01451 family)
MNIRTILFPLLILLLTTLHAVAAPGDISFDSIAEVEVETVTEKGEKVMKRQPATVIVPGTIVIYSNKITNNGTETAEGIVINNPVPEQMEYLAGSAVGTNTEITYSADGGNSFNNPEKLTVKNPGGTMRPAEPREYTHIMWVLGTPLPPGGEDMVEFRTRVK